MGRRLLLLLFSLLLSTFVKSNPSVDSVTFKPLRELSEWYKGYLSDPEIIFSTDDFYTDSTVHSLFKETKTELRMEMSPVVLNHIHRLLKEDREDLEIALTLYRHLESKIIPIAKELGAPTELLILPVILSGMNTHFISKSGTGLWKLNYYIGKQYGLKIDKFSDERKNPQKSTKAALKYLLDLHRKYKSWNLAITAFATSQLEVTKALQKAGNRTNYWDVRPYFNPYTQDLISSYFASVYCVRNYTEHDLIPPKIVLDTKVTPFQPEETVLLSVLSEIIGMPEKQLLLYNPEFRGKYVPPVTASKNFYIPGDKIQIARAKTQEIIAQTREKDKPDVSPSTYVKYGHPIPENSKKIIHIVQSGDVVGLIAEKYNVSASSLRRWNGIRGNRIYVGQKLKVYVNKNKEIDLPQVKIPKKVTINPEDTFTYEVKEGDTLWDIMKSHPGNSIEKIQELNGISSNLKPGQKIKLIKAK